MENNLRTLVNDLLDTVENYRTLENSDEISFIMEDLNKIETKIDDIEYTCNSIIHEFGNYKKSEEAMNLVREIEDSIHSIKNEVY